MFSLLMGFWQWLFEKAELHILIIGLDYAGKSTLLEQLKNMYSTKAGIPLDRIPPTVGLNIARVDIKKCRVIFWDLGGQERLRSIWNKYYNESMGLVFMVDSADEARFEEAKTTLSRLHDHPDLKDIPVLVLANKQDLDNAVSKDEIAARLNMDCFSSQPSRVAPISATTKAGVEESIFWLIDTVKNSDRYLKKTTTS